MLWSDLCNRRTVAAVGNAGCSTVPLIKTDVTLTSRFRSKSVGTWHSVVRAS